MIKLCFYERNGALAGFCCEGHSGYGEKGADIVCAAVSSAVELTERAINDIAKAGAEVLIDNSRACIRVLLPGDIQDKAKAVSEVVLRAMYETMSDYAGEYDKYLSVSKRELRGK